MSDSLASPAATAGASLILGGVTVVGTRDGSLAPNMDVRIEDGRIASVRAAGASRKDSSVRIVDGAGRFVVPGYLEMHAHPLELEDPSGALELMLANGVTGFRQMSGSPGLLERRRAGALPMPKDSPALLAMPGTLLTPANAGTAKAAVATVREQTAAGADFIKVGSVTPGVFFSAQAEAKRLGIPILGHLPIGIDVVAASGRGMRSIEHLGPGVGILAACSSDEWGVREALARRPGLKLKAPPFNIPFMERIMASRIRKLVVNPLAGSDPADVAILRRAVDTFSEEKCRDLAARFVADETWQVPTLIRERTSELADDPEFRNDPNLDYVAPSTVKEWLDVTRTFEALPAEVRATFRDAYALQLRLTKLFDDAGVKMMAGSDVSGAAWEVPGFSLHQEFDELARAGLPPLRVLQMATLNGAEFLGTTATMGTVEAGKDADLVLLDANPIEAADNLHAVFGVVRAGHYYSPADLEAVKARVAASKSAA